ncbi:MAG: hypothetical protein DAHOPDDO_03445 [Ignavibacteriaceae bacterium]|nr:hypothetical protein [Ignavibacteriaceae bacterium]
MKLKYFYQIVLILLIFLGNVYSQDFELKELKGKIKFGDDPGELGKNLQLKPSIPSGFVPDDIIFDAENSIYVCDKYSKRIIKYDSELNFLFEIKIDDEHFKGRLVNIDNRFIPEESLYGIHLETDKYMNLYILITQGEIFYRLMKYDKNGKVINNFKLDEPYPMERTTGILISSKNLILIRTTPYSPVNFGYFDKGLTFVYSLNGKFIGRTDYLTVDAIGYIYKRDTSNKRNALWIDQFEPLNNGNITQTASLKLNASLHTNLPENTSMPLLGIDSQNMLYYAGSGPGTPFLFKIFDFKDNKITEISLDRKELESRLLNQFSTVLFHDPFLLSPDGNIYLTGIKSKVGQITSGSKCNPSDIELNIFKLELNK